MICLKPSLNFSGDFLELPGAWRRQHPCRQRLWAVADGLADPFWPPICGEMVLPTSPPFIEPCLPGEQPPTGSDWVHEIEHEGYRLMARRDPAVIAPHELMVKLGRSLPSAVLGASFSERSRLPSHL